MLRRWIPDSASSVTVAAVAIALALTLPLAACSSDSDSSPTTTSSSVDPTAPTEPPTDLDATTTTTIGPAQISTRTTALGDILVDADGMTLYAKVSGPVDGCIGACLDAWPALRATSVKVGAGLDSAQFTVVDPNAAPSTTESTDTTAPGDPAVETTTTTVVAPAEGVVSVGGRLLYRFVGDAVPGDTTGQGFNATFFVVLADGTLVQPTMTTTTTSAP